MVGEAKHLTHNLVTLLSSGTVEVFRKYSFRGKSNQSLYGKPNYLLIKGWNIFVALKYSELLLFSKRNSLPNFMKR